MAKSSRLTIGLIESTRATSSEIWLSDDDGGRGSGRLALRISPSGSRLFYFRYFVDGKRTLISLGAYAKTPTANFLTLEEAREVAVKYAYTTRAMESSDLRTALLAKLAAAIAPTVPSLAPATVIPQSHPNGDPKRTVLELCDAYADHLRRRGAQSARTTAINVKNHVQLTPWAQIPAAELTAEQAAEVIRRVVDLGHTTTAKHLRQILHAAYNLAIHGKNDPMTPASFKQFGVSVNPVAQTAPMRGVIPARNRPTLTTVELGHIWLDLTQSKHDLSVAVRAVRLNFYLGGQRCLQLLRCTLANVNLESRMLRLHDGKGRRITPREHDLPLTSGAQTEVLALRQMANDLGNPYLIPGAVEAKPMTAGPLSQVMTKLSRRLCAQKKLAEPFCYANIRSTVETHLGELDVAPHVRAEIQSHDMGGVQKKNYDHAKYVKQKLRALEIWQQCLTEAAEQAQADNAVREAKRDDRPKKVEGT